MAIKLPKRSGLARKAFLARYFVPNLGYSEDFSKWFFLLAFQYASFDVYITIFGGKKYFGLRRGQVKFQVDGGPIKHQYFPLIFCIDS